MSNSSSASGAGGEIRWGTIIPLIGGSALGCQAAAGTKPLFHITYKPFVKNEVHIREGEERVFVQYRYFFPNSDRKSLPVNLLLGTAT